MKLEWSEVGTGGGKIRMVSATNIRMYLCLCVVHRRVSFRIFIGGGRGEGGTKATITDLRGDEDHSSTLIGTSMNTFVKACTPATFWIFNMYMYLYNIVCKV